ncbi:molecular chaperone DnaJ [Winogradskyella pacifica]|uniref:molecular chaperone DnaJ n=1 Tax=Winogradskyella pacifica TaxID=664642 RepID=UPI0015CDCC06|nr:molecular chaperone DnaJ [Winogradskyella pacifica]
MMMNNIQIKTDSLSVDSISKVVEVANTNQEYAINLWLYVAIIEFLIIGFLVYKMTKKKTDLDFSNISKDKLKSAKSSQVDMGNVMNSINGSKELYKQLSKRCHPDRFINSEKQELAETIFQDITKHKRNFQKLSELKERAKEELKIKM